MKTPYSWIKAYVPDLNVTPQEYTDAMTLTGTKVEFFERLDKNLEKIVIGQILSIEKHPDANKLQICQVQIDGQGNTVQIVTGASNIREGIKIPVVLDGGKVAGGHDGSPLPEEGIPIRAGKLRGVTSAGMMCSIEELGSSRDFYPEAPEEGIYIFDDRAVVGEDAVEALGLHDAVFEYEITSNRVDCYSIVGIAREAAATFSLPFYPPAPVAEGNEEKASDYIKVVVEDEKLCPRYCARVIKDIHLAPSPWWMQRRLAACGIRPINNLVDITNYVMMEYGQPMHAFDLDQVAGNTIIVRRAEEGKQFQTLDGQMRTLDSDMLMICDGEKPIGLAGIMGGENSKITDQVKNVLFESACFDGTNIRLSSKRLGLRTEASGIFEKGLDSENAKEAMDRACQLIEELGCGQVVGGMVDVYSSAPTQKKIPFRPQWINEFLGTDISQEEMLEYFRRIDLGYDKENREILVPSFRQDLEGEADIAEEVARFFGYDNIPTTLPRGEATAGKLSFKLRVEEMVREVAEYSGFSQGMSYSFESPKVFDKLLIPEDSPLRQAVTILNPLGEDFSIMRTLPLNGLLASLATNYNRRNKNVRLYELANVYLPHSLPLTQLPEERMHLALGFYGEGDFFTMKGVVEEIFARIGLKDRITYDPQDGKPFLHPGRRADMYYHGKEVGYLGELHPAVAENYDIGDRVYLAVLNMPVITEMADFDHKYTGIARFPAITRDISMVMKKEIPVGKVEEILEREGGKLLESFRLFDLYEGAQIQAGYKSVAYSVSFRDKERTLEDKDVSVVMEKILAALKKLGAELRA